MNMGAGAGHVATAPLRDPAAAGVSVTTSFEPTTPAPGAPASLRIALRDASTGGPLADLVPSHGESIHLIVVSEDLAEFQHRHPVAATGQAAVYTDSLTLPKPGRYLVLAEFQRRGDIGVLARTTVEVPGAAAPVQTLNTDRSPKDVGGGVRVALWGAREIAPGQPVTLTLRLTDPVTGEPVSDLAPYLGSAAHMIVLREGGDNFAHLHGEVPGVTPPAGNTAPAHNEPAGSHGSSGGGHGAASTTNPAAAASTPAPSPVGPEITVTHTFTKPGRYKLWAQVSTHHGVILTAPFVVSVR